MKIINAKSQTLKIDCFQADPGQAWCILGTNRSGMEDFFRLISGRGDTVSADTLDLPSRVGTVSFKEQQEIYENELKNDETDFLDRIDPGTPAREFLRDPDNFADLIARLDMTQSLDKGFRQLSTGQSRKLMLLSQICRGVSFLAIQSPFDGLDAKSCDELSKALSLLHRQGICLLLFVSNRSDIPDWITHAALFTGGSLLVQGPRDGVLPQMDAALADLSGNFCASAREFAGKRREGGPAELVRLEKGSAGYGGQVVFRDLDLIIRSGDHTLVSGSNGCGKSTLVQVITGDHPACYRNELRIFGIRRGSGESIWDLKQHMGIVSQDLHRNYTVPGSTLACILSGLFDSIGLYQQAAPSQEAAAMKWLERLDMAEEAGTPFRALSYSAQRLVLIARAMIKLPKLLILDEPTQGLDELNRKAVLDFLEDLAREDLSTILYVSHRQDEFRPFFRQQIHMGAGPSGAGHGQ